MRDPDGRALRRLATCAALGVLVGVIAAVLPSTAAAAHGQLAMSEPARDSTVSQPLESLLLYYTEKPAPNAYFALTSPTGIRLDGAWSHAEPKRLDKPVQEYFIVNGDWEPRVYNTGFPVRLTVAYWPEQGLYTARYLSVASDGEEVRGELRFSYNGPTSPPPAGWQPPTSQPDPALLAAVRRGPSSNASGSVGAAATPTSSPAVGAKASPGTPSTGVWVWLLPAVLLIAVAVIVVRAGRRPPAGEQAGRVAPPGAKPVAARSKPAKSPARAKRR